jgi:hypothetical protein
MAWAVVEPRGMGKALGVEDVGKPLTYIEKSLGFVLGFRVSPQIER